MSDRGQQTSPSEPGTPAPDAPVEEEAAHSAGDDLQDPPEPGLPEPGLPEPGLPEPGLPEPGLPEPGSSEHDSPPVLPEPGSLQAGTHQLGSQQAGTQQLGPEPVFEIEPERLEQVVAPEQPRGKVRTIVLSGLLAVAVVGAGTLAYVGWQINTQRHTTLSTPSTIGGLTLDDSEDAATTADYLQSALAAEITMDKSVGGVYTGDDDKSVLFFGGSTLLWAPGKELDNSFTLLGDEEGGVTGLSEVDAGELGGTMKCGVTTSEGTELTVCGWADHGSLALAMFLDRTKAEAAPLMREIRKATQTRD